jgi:hypothetical protein
MLPSLGMKSTQTLHEPFADERECGDEKKINRNFADIKEIQINWSRVQ